jgi:hypothetical protein
MCCDWTGALAGGVAGARLIHSDELTEPASASGGRRQGRGGRGHPRAETDRVIGEPVSDLEVLHRPAWPLQQRPAEMRLSKCAVMTEPASASGGRRQGRGGRGHPRAETDRRVPLLVSPHHKPSPPLIRVYESMVHAP